MNMIANQILLHNMYDMGAIKKETMAEFKTKDIIIKLERKDAQLWYTDTSYKYLCIITFIDRLTNREILKLSLSEIDVFVLMDNYDNYMETLDIDYGSLLTPMIYSAIDNSKYYFSLDNKTETSYDDLYLIVYQYNPENNTTLKRIQILLGTNELIDLFDLIYFTFLIDMVSNNFESIYG